jgi:hypothetical protein
MVSVVKMTIVLEYILQKSSVLLCTVLNWVEKFPEGRLRAADDGRPGAEVAETTVLTQW